MNSEKTDRAAEFVASDARLRQAIRGVDFSMSFIEEPSLSADELQLMELDRSESIEVLKRLAALGLGDYIQGRRGKPTRLDFKIGEEVYDELIRRVEERFDHSNVQQRFKPIAASGVSHSFWLRSDFEVRLRLPEDFSTHDAQRFSRWLETIPFD